MSPCAVQSMTIPAQFSLSTTGCPIGGSGSSRHHGNGERRLGAAMTPRHQPQDGGGMEDLSPPNPIETPLVKINGPPGTTGKKQGTSLQGRELDPYLRETSSSYGVTGNALNVGTCALQANPTAGAVGGNAHGHQRPDSAGTGECVTTRCARSSTQRPLVGSSTTRGC